MRQFSILLVDDSKSILKALTRTFKAEGYIIHTAESANEAYIILRGENIDMLITDENMPDISGTELLKTVRNQFPDVIRIMITGMTDIKVAQNAINNGEIYRFFNKPWDDFELLMAVRHACNQKQLEDENNRLKSTIDSQAELLNKLEKEHPGITSKNMTSDGAFIIEG